MPGWIKVQVLGFKTYIDILYPDLSEKLEWILPIQETLDDGELIQYVRNTNTDILCTSHYLWNHDLLTKQLARVRPRLNLKAIIAGGPSIDVNINDNFFEHHPCIDFAVYGPGEQAFSDIVNHIVTNTPLLKFNTSNCAWKNAQTGKIMLADYKFVKMLETSPFVHCAEMFERMVISEKLKLGEQTTQWMPYTLTRGCPYACTFCDWNSGLGNKLSRRKNTYQQDIDLFQKLGIRNIYLSDANVGQYAEDVDMIEYFAQKNLNENTNFLLSGNYSKLNKKNNFKIFDTMAKSGLVRKTFNFSLQDIDEQVLKNIDRPDVGWDVHVSMAAELTTKHPHMIVKCQIICGLPGQTVESWQHTMQEIISNDMLPVWFLNEPLPASPALFDPEYQKKWKFEYVKVTRVTAANYTNTFVSTIPKNSISFDQFNFCQMILLCVFGEIVSVINLCMKENFYCGIDTTWLFINLIESQGYLILCENLYKNWTKDNILALTQDFEGNSVKMYGVEQTIGLTSLLRQKKFLDDVLNLLPIGQKKQLTYLMNEKIFSWINLFTVELS